MKKLADDNKVLFNELKNIKEEVDDKMKIIRIIKLKENELLKTEERLNKDIKVSERDSVFTKDNILYNVLIRFPDGSTLKNYNDDQFPVIPFSRDDNLHLKDINLVKSQKIAKILEKLKKDEEKETKENQENNTIKNK